jgi:ABC-type lipoprotein release transport system permease subunit
VPLRWIVLMAWRGAWRTPRRSVLAVITIAAGLVVLIFLRGVQDGYVAQRIEAVVRLGAGHARVVPVGAAYLDPAQRVLQRVRRLPGLVGASARLRMEGYLRGARGGAGVIVIAFLPQDEQRVTDLPKFLRGGTLPPRKRKGGASIALGSALAARIGARIGDAVALLRRSTITRCSFGCRMRRPSWERTGA